MTGQQRVQQTTGSMFHSVVTCSIPIFCTLLVAHTAAFQPHNRVTFRPPARYHKSNPFQKDLKTFATLPPPPRQLRLSLKLFSTFRSENDEEEEDYDEDSLFNLLTGGSRSGGSSGSGGSDRQRRRDRIKNWISSEKKSMVRPISMDDGSVIEEEDSSSSARIKSNFDKFFAGMPSLQDILSSDDEDRLAAEDQAGQVSNKPDKPRRRATDESWFAEEKQNIQQNYNDILNDMLQKLEEQRRIDPDSVPQNAQAIMKSVLKQEMDRELEETKSKRLEEMMEEYEFFARNKADAADISGPVRDQDLQRLLDESEAEFQQREASRLEVEEFFRYEQEAIRRSSEEKDDKIQKPADGADLDAWALERLLEMARKREDEEGEEVVLEILEDNVEELQRRMQKESKRGSLQPETMKEWQMYRSIASRLADRKDDDNESSANRKEEESEIMARLESWKEYVELEEDIRKQSGLSRGPRLPFEWQETSLETRKDRDTTATKRSAIEVRREINRMSIQAMESLLERSDPARREKLQREIDYLKETLESNNYLDIEIQEEEEKEIEFSPVDLTGVFQTFAEDEDSTLSATKAPPSYVPYQTITREPDMIPPPPPPNTPFFSAEVESAKAPPPKTPFFDDIEPAVYESTSTVSDSKLGSFEDQKLQAMFRRSGVRSLQEQDEIRKQWEEFQQIEQEKRDIAGLSNDDDTGLTERFSAKYNVSEVMKDGDIDAEKILASIGPRPQRRKKRDPSDVEVSPAASSVKSLDEKEVVDSLYRSVAAAGGGRYKDDPDENERQKASFEEFVRLEREARQQLDDDTPTLEPVDEFVTEEGEFDDVEYANEALASLGPRPKPKRARVVDEAELSDLGGVLSEDDEDDEVAEQEAPDVVDDSMPEWLRKENEEAASLSGRSRARRTFLGKEEIEEVFDDDEYEKNMRQLAEYEHRRRTGKQRQIGIDISDVLGRTALESDDYADYKFDNDYFRGRQDNWGASSFESRKSNLLEYTELNVVELNSLMDLKDSVYATGVSQYTPRINKPFKEFGAIFRLEGVFLDITGFQLKAWTKVAKEHGFKPPDIEDVKRAAVTRAEVAVKEVFFWTDDFIECRRAAETHRIAFREAFDTWREANKIQLPQAPTPEAEKGTLALGAKLVDGSSIDKENKQKYVPESEILEKSWQAWRKTAEALGHNAPTKSQVVSAQTLSPDIAIKQLFKWSVDPLEVDKIAQLFQTNLQGADTPNQVRIENADEASSEAPTEPVTESDVLELQYHIWAHIAETYGFQKPLPEEVMAAYAINDPEIAVRDGFGWTTDSEMVAKVVHEFNHDFQILLYEISNGQMGQASPPSQETANLPDPNLETSNQSSQSLAGLSENQIWDLIKNAWTSTAKAYGVPVPSTEQIILAQKVYPREAIRKIFRWTKSDLEIESIASLFESKIRDSSNLVMSQYKLTAEPQVSSPAVKEKKPGPTQDEIFSAVLAAWTATARKSGFPDPDFEQVQFALTVGPEEAIVNGFEWTSSPAEVQSLIADYKAEIAVKRAAWQSAESSQHSSRNSNQDEELPMFKLIPGTVEWAKSLVGVEMQCGIVSYLERYQVDILMKETGLDSLIPPDKRVTASNGYRIDSQQLLGAALRLDRRPNHCVAFDSTPYSSAAAHDVEMQSVCVIGPYPRYELLSADTTTNSFEDMTAMNIRRLFGERVYDQPMLDMQQVDPQKMRKRKTKFYWEGDDY